jgi:hypothetical protein
MIFKIEKNVNLNDNFIPRKYKELYKIVDGMKIGDNIKLSSTTFNKTNLRKYQITIQNCLKNKYPEKQFITSIINNDIYLWYANKENTNDIKKLIHQIKKQIYLNKKNSNWFIVNDILIEKNILINDFENKILQIGDSFMVDSELKRQNCLEKLRRMYPSYKFKSKKITINEYRIWRIA